MTDSLQLVAEIAVGVDPSGRVLLRAELDGAPTSNEFSRVELASAATSRLITAAINAAGHQLQAEQIDGLVVTLQTRRSLLAITDDIARADREK